MPRVATKPARAPLFSSSALVTTVVACDSSDTSAGSMRLASRPWRMPSITAWPKSCGVVGSLAMAMRPVSSSTSATSVKVPPISMPIRHAMPHCHGQHRCTGIEASIATAHTAQPCAIPRRDRPPTASPA